MSIELAASKSGHLIFCNTALFVMEVLEMYRIFAESFGIRQEKGQFVTPFSVANMDDRKPLVHDVSSHMCVRGWHSWQDL